jgi:hypothetical protein
MKNASFGEATGTSKQPASGKGAKSAGGGGAGELAEPQERSKAKLIFCISVLLLIPGAVLFVCGLMEHADCQEFEESCIAECNRIYAEVDLKFQSSYAGRRTCRNKCQDEAATCRAKGMSVALGGATLGGGLVGGTCLVAVLEALVRRYGGAAAIMDNPRPRPAYQEPAYTEEEKRKQHPKPKDSRPRLVEARCLDCDVEASVDYRWRTCEKGGMEGAICPRCKKVIVGVL